MTIKRAEQSSFFSSSSFQILRDEIIISRQITTTTTATAITRGEGHFKRNVIDFLLLFLCERDGRIALSIFYSSGTNSLFVYKRRRRASPFTSTVFTWKSTETYTPTHTLHISTFSGFYYASVNVTLHVVVALRVYHLGLLLSCRCQRGKNKPEKRFQVFCFCFTICFVYSIRIWSRSMEIQQHRQKS